MNKIIICFKCEGTGRELHSERICEECEGSGRLQEVIRYEKYGSVVDEATKLLSDELKEKYENFEDYLKKALVKNEKAYIKRNV